MATLLRIANYTHAPDVGVKRFGVGVGGIHDFACRSQETIDLARAGAVGKDGYEITETM